MAMKDVHDDLTSITDKDGVEVARVERSVGPESPTKGRWHAYQRVEGPNPAFEASTYTYHFAEVGVFDTKTEALSAVTA